MGAKPNEVSCIRKARDHQNLEQSHLTAKRTLDQLGIARRTFYRWYNRYLEGGPEALEGSAIGAKAGMEPHRRRYPGPDRRYSAGLQ